jgi:hypothetical protein
MPSDARTAAWPDPRLRMPGICDSISCGDWQKYRQLSAASLDDRVDPRRIEFHWPNRVQKPTNTWVDNMNPSTMLTATPAVKA